MRQMHDIRTALIGLLLVGAALPASAQSIALDSLPQAAQDEISQVCLPVQFREGAGAYRNCVQAELDLRSSSAGNDMAKLSFDDKYAVQQACARAGGQSSVEYQTCVSDQIRALSRLPAPNFDNISEDELYVIQQTCFDAQSTQGAANYRQCLNSEIQSVLAVASVDTSDLDMLNKNALQLRCSATAETAANYRQCIAIEYESITGNEPTVIPATIAQAPTAPEINETAEQTSSLSSALPTSVQDRQARALAAVAAQAEAIEANQQPSPSPTNTIAAEDSAPSAESIIVSESEVESTTVMALPRNINPRRAQLESIIESTTLSNTDTFTDSNYDSLRDATSESLAIEDFSSSSTINQAAALPDPEPRVISRPELVKELETKRLSESQGIEFQPQQPAMGAASDSPADQALDATQGNASTANANTSNGLWEKFLDTLASLDGIGWLIVAGVLALPALLLGLFSIFKNIKQPKETAFHSPSLSESLNPDTTQGPGIQTRMARHEQEAAELFGDKPKPAKPKEAEVNTPLEPKPEVNMSAATEQLNEHPEHDDVTRMATKSEQVSQSTSNFAWQSAFGHWLTQQPESARLEICIEFLIYWIAYGDERFEPELKQRLFTSNDHDLSPQDQIKRWVLKQDVFAFSDVIVWMRGNASQTQLDQSIDLALAMLVTENCITPSQNTVFRFLADAFNMGKEQLEQRFESSFGHALPDLPRPDKNAWWDKQSMESIDHWDSRAMAAKPELDQMKARLGLHSEIDDTQVISAFRRAARRCHPDRFTDLGERERAFAAQTFTKFEQARDKLLGVSV